ncbi:glycoside hydrolase domain-containing protein [Kribbella sp. NPDC058245]|uniref:glycoside hydrolase domain-containing protein n=1 Tax=Kribbella sp. NPDC058245 TaxID=3346399 RepID=UPI0036E806DD
MPSVRRLVIAAVVAAVAFAPNAQAGTPPPTQRQSVQVAPGIDYWTEPSSASVFQDSLPSKESGRAIALDAAANEEESAQIVLRSSSTVTVDGVSFSALTSTGKAIAASNLSYNFVTYKHLNANTVFGGNQPIYPVVRKAPGDFPDPLSNARTASVGPRTSLSIWVTAAVPKGTAAGVYTGTATVATNAGPLEVPISVDVRGITLPDPKDQTFETTLWNTFFGEISWKPDGRTIEQTYQYERYTPQYWDLMEKVAVQMKRHRTNTLTLPLVNMLLDGNTTVTNNSSGTGVYSFDWSKIDQVVQFMVDRGVVKRLEGFWVSADTDNWGRPADGIREVEIVDGTGGKGSRNYVNWDSAKAKNFIDQFIPELHKHLDAKGWTEGLEYWMHVGDEPGIGGGQEETAWRGILARMRTKWPTVRVGDAAFHEPVAASVSKEMSVVIPNLLNYDQNQAAYDALRAQGKDLYLYNCNIPVGNYLNRFIDQPQFNQRLTPWYAYSRGANGYLHYSMNGWLANLDDVESKGDHYIVWPDKDNNTIQSSIRYESLRDGIEDYEVLNILGTTNPKLARDLATALTQRADKYSPDTGYQARIRRLALDAAAGKPIAPDLARNTTATASSVTAGHEAAKAVDGDNTTSWQPSGTGAQWLQVDFGRQVQLDGLQLNWSGTAAGSYDVKVSYDGARWSTAYSGGGGAFAGINGKARYVRVEFSSGVSGLNSLEVAGSPLAKQNLLGGRSYSVNPAPNDKPDSGFESTDGVLADAHDDGRTYGFGAGQGTATIQFDLGSAKSIDEVRLHAYEEYPAYRPDRVTIATSTDNVTWQQKGFLPGTPNDQSKIWYQFDFPPTTARYVRVTLNKTFTADASVMLVDEIEAYGAIGPANLAAGASYTKDNPPHANYPDTGNKESTDGVIAGHHDDTFSYGYNFGVGTTGWRKVTVDLGSVQQLGRIEVHDNFDGVTKYSPDKVRISAGETLDSVTEIAATSVSSAQWFRFPVQTKARYVQVEYEKYSQGNAADWIFVDEIAVYPS